MAKTKTTPNEYVRFTMTNSELKDVFGEFNTRTLKDWQTQVNAMEKALKSATNSLVRTKSSVDEYGKAVATFDVPKNMSKNASAVFGQKLADFEVQYDYNPGEMMSEPYTKIPKEQGYRTITTNKSIYGSLAKRTAQEEIEKAGGTIRANPTRKNKDRMEISFSVSEEEWQEELKKSKNDETKAKRNLTNRYFRNKMQKSEKFSKDVQEENEEKERQEQEKARAKDAEKQKKENLAIFAVVLKVLQSIVDICKRILVATLDRASQIKEENVDAKNLNVTPTDIRKFNTTEKAMGLKEGSIASAIANVQSAFGNITSLDEKALGELARVMGSDIVNAINLGLGKNEPEKVVENILNTYFERGQQGINSIGQNVGKVQAERELTSALEKAGFSDMAEILRNMFYTNDNGIYKGQVKDFETYINLSSLFTNGLSNIDHKKASELGQTIDLLKARFEDLKKNLEEGLLLSLQGVIQKINNLDFGKSANEKKTENISNVELNQKAIEKMQNLSSITRSQIQTTVQEAGIDFSVFGEGKDIFNFTKDVNGKARKYEDLSEQEKKEYTKLQYFMSSDKGLEVASAMLLVEEADRLEKQAKDDIIQGRRTGNTPYRVNDYTDVSIQQKQKKVLEDYYINIPKNQKNAKTIANGVGMAFGALTGVHTNLGTITAKALEQGEQTREKERANTFGEINNKGALGMFNLATTSLQQTLEYDEATYKSKIKQGGDNPYATYEEILKNGTSSRKLTDEVYETLLPKEYQTAGYNIFTRQKKKEQAILKAISDGVLTEDLIRLVQVRGAQEDIGYGLGKFNTAEEFAERFSENSAMSVGATTTLTDALQMDNVQKVLNEYNTSNAKATLSNYNEKTGEVMFTLTVKDEKTGKSNVVFSQGINTDTVLQTGATYNFDLASITSTANARGSK